MNHASQVSMLDTPKNPDLFHGSLKRLGWIWLFFCVTTLFFTYLIQAVVLRLVFQDWGTSDGLLVGHDSTRFHRLAVEQADSIRMLGWSAWELRPQTQTIAGVMSAWYAMTISHPLSWAVVQSAVYATGATLLFLMLSSLIERWRPALIAVCLLVFQPSAAMIYSLPHHDALVFCGFMLFVCGWLLLFQRALVYAFVGGGLVISGFLLMTLFRGFLENVFLVISALLLFLLVVWLLIASINSRSIAPVVWLLIPVMTLTALFNLAGGSSFRPWAGGVEPVTDHAVVDLDRAVDALSGDVAPHAGSQSIEHDDSVGNVERSDQIQQYIDQGYSEWESQLLAAGWQSFRFEDTSWIPRFIDSRAEQLAIARDAVILTDGHGRSSIDIDVRFTSLPDILAYLPRAVQIGFLSPFPHHWLPHPDAPVNRQFERMVAGVEMLIIYLFLLPAFLFAMLKWWRQPLVWIVLLTASVYILVYALAFPVVGSLVRYRFPAFSLLLGISLVYLFSLYQRRPV